MSLGANLLSIFVPSYFLTVTKPPLFKGDSTSIKNKFLLILNIYFLMLQGKSTTFF